MIKKLNSIEESGGLTAFQCSSVCFIELKKRAVVSDHTHKEKEIIYLMKGQAELTLEGKTQKIEAPVEITVAPGEYHKFVALTDCIGLEIKG